MWLRPVGLLFVLLTLSEVLLALCFCSDSQSHLDETGPLKKSEKKMEKKRNLLKAAALWAESGERRVMCYKTLGHGNHKLADLYSFYVGGLRFNIKVCDNIAFF